TCTLRSPPRTTRPSTASTPPPRAPATATTGRRACGSPTTRATTARSSSTPTGTTSRSSATTTDSRRGDPDRVQRLELRALARSGLRPRAGRPLARPLRRALPDGRGERVVLPVADAAHGAGLGGARAGPVRVRGQDEPLRHPHPPPARRAGERRAADAADRAAGRGGQARTASVAAARELPARRRAAGGGTAGAAGGPQLLRVPPPVVVLPRGARDAGGGRCGARRRRPSAAAVPDARADRGLDVCALPLRRARAARQLLRDGAARVGAAHPQMGPAGRRVRLLQQRLGGVRRSERGADAGPPRRMIDRQVRDVLGGLRTAQRKD